MRICLVHSEPEKLPRIQLEYQTLRRAGYDAYILSPKLRTRFEPKALAAIIRYSAFLVQAICQQTDAYLVSNCPDIWGIAPIIRRKRWIYDVRSPWAEELHAFGHGQLTVWFAEKIERYMTRHADAVLAVNRVLEQRAREWGARKVYVLPNYPPADFQPTVAPEEFKMQQGLSGKRIVLFVGKFSAVECTLDLVRVTADLLKSEDDIVLVMVGDGPERPSIERFLEERGMTDRVRITGWIANSLVPNWIAIADVCVLPRREDAPSAKFYSPHSVRKVGEYLALGKPVISTPVGEFAQSGLPIITVPLSDFSAAIKMTLRESVRVLNPSDFTWEKSEKVLLEACRDLERTSG
jgi:glycosyltransferase involved in cell wall biosynthesis